LKKTKGKWGQQSRNKKPKEAEKGKVYKEKK